MCCHVLVMHVPFQNAGLVLRVSLDGAYSNMHHELLRSAVCTFYASGSEFHRYLGKNVQAHSEGHGTFVLEQYRINESLPTPDSC